MVVRDVAARAPHHRRGRRVLGRLQHQHGVLQPPRRRHDGHLALQVDRHVDAHAAAAQLVRDGRRVGPAARQIRADRTAGAHPRAQRRRGGAAERPSALVDHLADQDLRGGLVVPSGAHHPLRRVDPLGSQSGHHADGLGEPAGAERRHGQVPVGVVRRAGAQSALVVRHFGEEIGDGAEDAGNATRIAGHRESVETLQSQLVEHAEADDLADDAQHADVLALAENLLQLGESHLQIETMAPFEGRARIAVRQDIAQTDSLAGSPALHRLHIHMGEVLQPQRHVQLVFARRQHREQLRRPQRPVVSLRPDALLGQSGHFEEPLPGLGADRGLRRSQLRLDGVVDGVADDDRVMAVLQSRGQHALVGRGAIQRGHRDLLHGDPVAHRHIREGAELREEGARADRPRPGEAAVLQNRARAAGSFSGDQRVHHHGVLHGSRRCDVALHVASEAQARGPRGGLCEELDILFLPLSRRAKRDYSGADVDEIALLRNRHVELNLAKMLPENRTSVSNHLHTTHSPKTSTTTSWHWWACSYTPHTSAESRPTPP